MIPVELLEAYQLTPVAEVELLEAYQLNQVAEVELQVQTELMT